MMMTEQIASFRGHPAAAPLTRDVRNVGKAPVAAFRGHPAAAPLTQVSVGRADGVAGPSAAIRPRPH